MLTRFTSTLISIVIIGTSTPLSSEAQELTIFVAKKVVTMEPSMPTATVVAVRDDRIVAVGSMKTIQPWLDAYEFVIDETFKDKVLFPGFIDPHLHPGLGASLLVQNEIITPEDWTLPTGLIKGVTDRASYLARLTELVNRDPDSSETFFTWGWNRFWHGPLTRQDLDAISTTRPIVVTQRSAHEIVLNTAALNAANIGPDVANDVSTGIDWEKGIFWEDGRDFVDAAIAEHLSNGDNFEEGLALVADLIHRGGVTTISDPGAAPMVGSDEWQSLVNVFDNEKVPFRTLLIPFATTFDTWPGDGLLAKIENAQKANTDRLIFTKGIKHMADGAMFAQYMQLGEPGYIDGHSGEWLTPPDELKTQIEPFWDANFDINVHVNGDLGVDATLDALEAMLEKHPHPDIRFVLQHFGFSRPDQASRIARLGATVSATGYYLWLLGDKYAEVGIGPDRADRMVRLGSLVRNSVKVSLHSDLPMGPVQPLLAVWSVTTRKTATGTVRGPEEALSLEQAMRSITIDAAWTLRLDHEIGSIVAGKKADFTVLDENPFEVSPDHVKDIKVWGTVFEGTIYPVID